MKNKFFRVYFGKPGGLTKKVDAKIIEARNAKEAIKIFESENPDCTPLIAKAV